MKVSLDWINAYLSKPVEAQEASRKLTDTGLEVEETETIGGNKNSLETILVGYIIDVENHPNADKLRITKVDVGDNILNIVCGASNVDKGQKVFVATIGTTLWAEGKLLKIKKSKIRGEISEGMICSAKELGVGHEKDGIMILTDNPDKGTKASNYFKIDTTSDTSLEIGLTPNRTDAMSHVGVARDLSAAYCLEDNRPVFKPPIVTQYPLSDSKSTGGINIENQEPNLCVRYSGVLIESCNVKPSSKGIQKRLKAIGIEPKNNVVDITNFILHELGQPLHAFDAAKIKEDKVVIRRAKEQERISTLVGDTKKLVGSDLVIANTNNSMCIAGVIGGGDSAVSEQTTRVFLESACFDAKSIRKTCKYHKLNTEASYRYERGVDPNLALQALNRALDLIRLEMPSVVIHSIVDNYPKIMEPVSIELKKNEVDRILGYSIPTNHILRILTALEIDYLEQSKEVWKLCIPTYRVDVTRPIDVIEEIVRIYGFNAIPIPENFTIPVIPTRPDLFFDFQYKIRNILEGIGFMEIINNSITQPDSEQSEYIELKNPLSQKHTVMRRSLINQGLETVSYNLNHNQLSLAFYEIGKKYFKQKGDLKENTDLIILITGLKHSPNWTNAKSNGPVSFFEGKSVLEYLLNKLFKGLDAFLIEQTHSQELECELTYKAKSTKQTLARVGLSKKKLKQPVYVVEIDLEYLFMLQQDQGDLICKSLNLYPRVRRDLSFLIASSVSYQQVESLCRKHAKDILKEVNLVDIYKDKSFKADEKSYSIALEFLSEKKTLTDMEVEMVMHNIITDLENTYQARLR